MSRFKTIIIDDERLARNDLKSMLQEFKNIEVIAEADSVNSALKLIDAKDPDLIFLDIQMPGESGFELLDKIDLKAKVIFVTAFDEYAIKAFEVDAVDYLLKPVNPERLKTAIDRLERESIGKYTSKRKLDYDDMMFLNLNNHLKFFRVKSIVNIQAAGDYSEIFTSDGKKGLVQKPMAEWEERLPEKYFIRIHRSTIINMEYTDRVEEWFNNSYHVFMKDIETPFIISRRYATKLKERLE
jgi:two-component system, LytTR family, response regulator